jgi:hypothetical protein
MVSAAHLINPESIALNWKAVQDALKASGKGTLISFEDLGPDFKFKYIGDLMRGKPNLGEFGRLNDIGGGGLMPLSPVCQVPLLGPRKPRPSIGPVCKEQTFPTPCAQTPHSHNPN